MKDKGTGKKENPVLGEIGQREDLLSEIFTKVNKIGRTLVELWLSGKAGGLDPMARTGWPDFSGRLPGWGIWLAGSPGLARRIFRVVFFSD